ncbi:zinc finger protein ZFMSA12A-like isoform X38 [Euwallacea similis]|uniref:zinc finger protein ZFMSA12A-like isoform X38 n=1 Tax=Euwallacea similis TaxID=1736056 RepID=UPI00344F88BC
MDNPGEILRLCRLCLVKDQVNIPIFEEQGDIRQTFLKIRSCLPVKVSRDDKLPKKICGGCSNKLDLFYEFWSSTANSEKTLQSWLGQEEEDDKMQEITKPVEALVKEESEALEDGHAHDQSFDEATKDEAEAPPAKRARRTAAVKAQINISHDSDEDEDVDGAEPITKIEDESDDSDGEEKDPSYTEVPGTSADDQAGPSGLGKDGVEAPLVLAKRTSKKKVQCETCGRIFNSRTQLQYHIRNLIVKVISKCLDCHSTSPIYDKDCNHSEDIRTFHRCEICGRQVEEPFHDHACFHLHPKKLVRRSNNCRRRAVDVDVDVDAENSVDGINWSDEFEKCIYCNTTMAATLLNKHESWHRRFDKNVKDLLEVKPSIRIHKDTEGLCAYCGVLKPGNKLRRHEYVEHVKKYIKKVCDICGIFTCPTYIKEHMRTHDSEKGFKCEDCGKAFFRKKALARHRLVHSDEARYVCTICGKSFKIKFNLRVHMRSHDDVKPFPCSVCKKTFTTKQWRDNHLKTHGIVGNK